ncbi:Na+/H+ antiporter subunit B [Kushneria aurantia]|uniref:Na+/H+ antiporter subunit B n=1 Tax=Kushneria aurantia TaxID=504092 RepID=A0ABV6G4W6_9GAMM|nr:Na+/H+ antiporter subunit B [Kushneria aurantia]
MKTGTLILSVAARMLVPLQVLFSIFLLLRGHNEPGGGFIAGLVVAGAFALHQFVYGPAATRRLLRVDPRDCIGFGLVLGVVSALPAWLAGEAFMTAQWWPVLNTPLIFDVGVYLVVLGSVLTAVITLTEVDKDDY